MHADDSRGTPSSFKTFQLGFFRPTQFTPLTASHDAQLVPDATLTHSVILATSSVDRVKSSMFF